MDKKIIMITGASSGIGRGTAKYLADKGHTIILMARNIETLKKITFDIRKSGGVADFFKVDVRDIQTIERAVQITLKKYGKIDVFLSNAGIMPLNNLLNYDLNEWYDLIETNLKGVLNTIASILPIFEKQNKGDFIYTSSTASKTLTNGSTVYSAVKECVNIIMEGLRKEVSDFDIKVCTIIPGTFKTNLYKSVKNPKFANETFHREMTLGLDPLEFAKSIEFIINQEYDTTINEIVIRPTHQKN